MLRRSVITMSDTELADYLGEQRTVTCATMGANGRPHLMPLWYTVQGHTMTCWTFAKSQKARNIERLPQATLQVESGTRYEDLRGAMLECDVELIRDLASVTELGLAIMQRYAPSDAPLDALRAAVAKQAPKRVGLRFHPTRVVTWNHRKLGGTY